MRGTFAWLTWIALILPNGARAQWHLAAELGTVRFSGTARDSAGVALGPRHATSYGLRISRQFGPRAVGLWLRFSDPGITGAIGAFTVTDQDALSLLELSPDVSLTLAGIGSAGSVNIEVGPAVDYWVPEDDDARFRVGLRAAVRYDWDVVGRFGGSFRVAAAVTPSLLEASEAFSGVTRRASWRRGWAVSLRYRL